MKLQSAKPPLKMPPTAQKKLHGNNGGCIAIQRYCLTMKVSGMSEA